RVRKARRARSLARRRRGAHALPESPLHHRANRLFRRADARRGVRMIGSARILSVLFAAWGACGCSDPLLDARISTLGDEKPGVAPSEYHRPGQPCAWCHGDYGGATPLMTVAGTVFAKPDGRLTVGGAIVNLKDAAGKTLQKATNCVGNFYATASEWDPTFP